MFLRTYVKFFRQGTFSTQYNTYGLFSFSITHIKLRIVYDCGMFANKNGIFFASPLMHAALRLSSAEHVSHRGFRGYKSIGTLRPFENNIGFLLVDGGDISSIEVIRMILKKSYFYAASGLSQCFYSIKAQRIRVIHSDDYPRNSFLYQRGSTRGCFSIVRTRA